MKSDQNPSMPTADDWWRDVSVSGPVSSESITFDAATFSLRMKATKPGDIQIDIRNLLHSTRNVTKLCRFSTGEPIQRSQGKFAGVRGGKRGFVFDGECYPSVTDACFARHRSRRVRNASKVEPPRDSDSEVEFEKEVTRAERDEAGRAQAVVVED